MRCADARTVGAFEIGENRRERSTRGEGREGRTEQGGGEGMPTPIGKGGDFFACYLTLDILKKYLGKLKGAGNGVYWNYPSEIKNLVRR